MKKILSIGILSLAALFAAPAAHAFCGFYVAKADANLFNDASKVVLARHDDKTVITMANDYRGAAEEFAMVVPVPTVLKRGQINVAERALIDHIDAYTAPRLVEYYDENPCLPPEPVFRTMQMSAKVEMADAAGSASAKALGVKIEAQYAVGEYDITILSGKESTGLITWLRQEGYKVPEAAAPTVRSYLKQGLYFFLAKINLERREKSGAVFLRPLQVAFESPKFGLPIRLGTVNADKKQDLIIYTLTQEGRVEPVNYRMTQLPTDLDVPGYIKNEFGQFYKDLFEHAVKKEDYRTVMLEYAWNTAWCDPCAADPLSRDEMRNLGAFWVEPEEKKKNGDASPRGRFVPQPPPPQVYVTRMHVRYDGERFPEDLRFQETSNNSNFQSRYVLRHAWEGEEKCEAVQNYRDALQRRRHEEAQNLARLTGRDVNDIRQKMAQTYKGFDPKAGDDRPWYEKLWAPTTQAEDKDDSNDN